MKKSKLDYSAPEAEVFVVMVEKRFCDSRGVNLNGATRGNGYGTTSMYYLEDDVD